MAMLTKNKVIETILLFMKEFGPAFIADWLVNNMTGSKSVNQATLAQAAEHMAAGRVDEARAVLHAHPGGIGLADEMILFTDLLSLRRLKRLTGAQVRSMLATINGLSANRRKRFRLAHVLEHDARARRENLIELGKMTPGDRLRHLEASGLFEPGPEEQLEETERDVLRFVTAYHNRQRRRNRIATTWQIGGRNIPNWLRQTIRFVMWPIRVPFEALRLW